MIVRVQDPKGKSIWAVQPVLVGINDVPGVVVDAKNIADYLITVLCPRRPYSSSR
jgi:hypothetical protein